MDHYFYVEDMCSLSTSVSEVCVNSILCLEESFRTEKTVLSSHIEHDRHFFTNVLKENPIGKVLVILTQACSKRALI